MSSNSWCARRAGIVDGVGPLARTPAPLLARRSRTNATPNAVRDPCIANRSYPMKAKPVVTRWSQALENAAPVISLDAGDLFRLATRRLRWPKPGVAPLDCGAELVHPQRDYQPVNGRGAPVRRQSVRGRCSSGHVPSCARRDVRSWTRGQEPFEEGTDMAHCRVQCPVLVADVQHHSFETPFDVVCLFDVIEHRENDVGALEDIRALRVPRGRVILTEPGHPELWSGSTQLPSSTRACAWDCTQGSSDDPFPRHDPY